MDELIMELIKIDERGKDIVHDVKEEQKVLKKRIQENIVAIEQKINEDTDNEIRKVRSKAQEEAWLKTNEISNLVQRKFSELELEFYNNNEKWQNEIFERVISTETGR